MWLLRSWRLDTLLMEYTFHLSRILRFDRGELESNCLEFSVNLNSNCCHIRLHLLKPATVGPCLQWSRSLASKLVQ
jgi:hypothetical protein